VEERLRNRSEACDPVWHPCRYVWFWRADTNWSMWRSCANSHEANLWALNETEIRWCLYASNLLGDPETSVNVPAGKDGAFVMIVR
jgi:hypothetical protein